MAILEYFPSKSGSFGRVLFLFLKFKINHYYFTKILWMSSIGFFFCRQVANIYPKRKKKTI
jgi:hypothetical protein